MEPFESLIPAEQYSSPIKTMNNIGDTTWILTDSLTGKQWTTDWTWPYKRNRINWAQSFILECCDGYTDKWQSICARQSTTKANVAILRRWMQFAETFYPDIPLCAWSLAHLIQLLQFSIHDRLEGSTEKVLSRGSIATLVTLLNKSYSYYHLGNLVDGISCNIPTNLTDLALRELIEKQGLNFDHWRKGGNYISVPLHIASLLLADAMRTLHATPTRVLLAYFDHQRSQHCLSYNVLFTKKVYNRVIRYGPSSGKGFRPVLMENIALLSQSLNNAADNTLTKLPWDNHEELTPQCKQVFNAAIVTLLCLTGIRTSELSSLEASWFKQKGEDWEFKSEIAKTDHGLITVRSLTGLAAEAANVLARLSYVDKNQTGFKLLTHSFTCTFLTKKVKPERIKTLGSKEGTTWQYLQTHYEAFIARNGEEIRKAHPNIHPHQFRHTFAEFALRRFDGNILEAIRHHFRHAAGSYMTLPYTNNKLTEEAHAQLERDYLAELIQRMQGDEAIEFSGPIALHIKKQIKASHLIGNADEIDAAIDVIADEFEHIIAHEWGFCVLRKVSKAEAKCLDRKTGLPDVLGRSSFRNCSGCPHRLSHRSQKKDIYRIGLSHQHFIDNYPLPRVTENSKVIVKRCEIMLQEMEDK